MSAEARCWECRRLVPEGELEVGQDGRPMCCCCRLKESGEKLAEQEQDDRSTQTADCRGRRQRPYAGTRTAAPGALSKRVGRPLLIARDGLLCLPWASGSGGQLLGPLQRNLLAVTKHHQGDLLAALL